MSEKTFASFIARKDITSAELAEMCDGHKVKRTAHTKRKYRQELPGRSGNYARRLVKREYVPDVKYVKGAYRQDAKRAGNSPNLWGWVIPEVTRAAKKI